MKRKIHKLLSSTKQIIFALALTVFSGEAYSQTTYTFMYTGGVQTLALQAGSYDIQTWGGKGETAGSQPGGGIGGYSSGTYSATSPTTIYIAVGGKGSLGSTTNAFVNGGWNCGGQGYGSTTTGAGGGGASHIATATGILSALSSNTTAIIIVAGGGGGSGWAGAGGNGGGTTGGNGNTGTGGSTGGTFGQGANGTTAGTCGGGGGGWFGGNLGSPGNTGGAGGGSGYIGGVSSGITVQTGQTGFVSNPDVSGNGLVIIKEICGINLIASGSNSVNPALCSGQSLTITTNAISNYSWSTGATSNSIVVAPTTNTVYSLTAMSPSNCMTTANMSVTVSSGVPVLTLAATPASVCVGDSVKLNATGALSYTWSNGMNNNQLFPPAQTSTYVVTGKNGCGTTTAAITVSALPLPVAILSTTNTSCSGSPVTLTVTGGSTYTWSTNQTASVIVVAPTSQTTYTVLGKKGHCQNTNSITISTNPLPIVQLVGSSTMVCAGNSVTLTASGGNNYTWTPSNFNGTTITDTPTTSINYIVSGSNAFGCAAGANHLVLVNPLPTITVNSNQPIICPGATVTLMAAGGHTYTWNTGAQTKSIVVNPNSTTQYTVTGTFTNTGCNDEAYYSVNVDQPTLAVSPSQTVCPGTLVTMTVNGSNQSWSNGGTGAFNAVTVTTPTMYTVSSKVLTANNLQCQASGTIDLGMHPKPVVVATAAKSEICQKEKTVLTASGADTYLWTNNNHTGATLTFSLTQLITHTYTVIGTDVNGCMDTAQVSVKVNACTGLSESSLSEISVYPNPSHRNFTVKSEHNVVLHVWNELGQLLRVVELNAQNQRQVQISDLPKGIYFIKGEYGNSSIKHKLIVE